MNPLITPTTTIGVLDGANSGLREQNQRRMDEVGSGFEGIFLNMLLEPLEKVGESFFGGGSTGRIFGGLNRQQLADAMASAKPLGISKMFEDTVRQQLESTVPSLNDPEVNLQEELGQLRAQHAYGRNLQ